MDTVLEISDEYFFDYVYGAIWPAYTKNVAGSIISSWPRDDLYRASLSLFLITIIFGWLLYLISASLSYYYVFDHDYMKHPKFLKGQIRMEIECALGAIPYMASKYYIKSNSSSV